MHASLQDLLASQHALTWMRMLSVAFDVHGFLQSLMEVAGHARTSSSSWCLAI